MPAFHRPNSFARAVAGLVMVPAILLSACGGSSASSGTSGLLSVGGPQPTTQKSIRAEVPASILAEAPLQIATDASYAPNEFVDPNTGDLTGWDLVLATEVCKVLGVACTINNVTFDDIIPALLETPSKYVMSFSSYTPTAEREATGIDFVTYYQAGESWLVRVGGPTITEASQMCGHTVAVEAGTVEESDAWGYMGKQPGGDAIAGDTDHCTSAGLQDITVESFDSQTEANTALLGSRADFGWADQPVADYQVQQESGKLKISGQPCSVDPYGVAVVKTLGMDKAVSDALSYLIQNGFYSTILKKYGVQDGAIAASAVSVNNNNPVGATCVPSY
jgi:polar amino acid transport system substrate-binding protein